MIWDIGCCRHIPAIFEKKYYSLTQDFVLTERLSIKATSFMQSSLIPLPSVTPFLPWQQSMVVESPDWRRLPSFKSQLCYLLAVWPQASCLASLCFSRTIRKTAMIILPIWRGFVNIPQLQTYKVLKVVPATKTILSECQPELSYSNIFSTSKILSVYCELSYTKRTTSSIF